jgi:hypothetical protein
LKVKVNCSHCKSPLFRFPSQLKSTKFGPFCNQKCLGLYRSEHLTGNWAANFQKGSSEDRGYVLIKAHWHPKCQKDGYIYIHRVIMEARLGRFLEDNEIVHHKDEDKMNNHWDNLEVMTQSEHAREHFLGSRRKNGTFHN